MDSGPKKRRGRPRKEFDEDHSLSGQRKARARELQRAHRQHRDNVASSQVKKITALHEAIEHIMADFLELSDTMLQSQQVVGSSELVSSIHNTTRKALRTAVAAVRLGDEQDEQEENGGPPTTNSPEVAKNTTGSHPIICEERPLSEVKSSQQYSLPFIPQEKDQQHQLQSHTRSDIGPAIRSSTFRSLNSIYFSNEFWTADYTNYSSALPGATIPSYLSFWQRLLRTSFVGAYHTLQNDSVWPTPRARIQFRFSIKVRSAGFILANMRHVLGLFDQCDQSTSPQDVAIEHFFLDDAVRRVGLDTKAEMVRQGERPDQYIDASEVGSYLEDKGQFYYEGQIIKMVLDVPGWSKGQPGEPRTENSRKLITVSVERLIDRLASACICMGDVVGYPKAKLDAAVVASIISVVD